MTPLIETPVELKARKRKKPGRSIRLHNVDWDTYEKLLEAFGERQTPRMIYDRGELELMSPIGYKHEVDAEFLAALIAILAEEMDLMFAPCGSFTLKRKSLKRGMQPDKCYYIASVPKIEGVRGLDMEIHPPPDLAIEVDVSNNSLDKVAIYAKLGVPELWRLEGDDLQFLALGGKGRYVTVEASTTFSGIHPADLLGYVKEARAKADMIPITRAFRAWVRSRRGGSS